MNRHYFAYRSFNPEFETMKRFVDIGLDTICFFPGHSNNSLGLPYSKYPPTWYWYGKYNFDSLDRNIITGSSREIDTVNDSVFRSNYGFLAGPRNSRGHHIGPIHRSFHGT